jgi:hypothetical protein
VGEILPTKHLTHAFKGSLTCRKSTTWDRQLYFPSEGSARYGFLIIIFIIIAPVGTIVIVVILGKTCYLFTKSVALGFSDKITKVSRR